MNQTNLLHKYTVMLLSFLFAGLLAFAGNACREKGMNGAWIANLLIVLLSLIFILSLLFSFRRERRAKPSRMKMKSLLLLCRSYGILLFLALAADVFFCGAAYREAPLLYIPFLCFLAYEIFTFAHAATMHLQAGTDCVELSEEEYPEIYEIAKRAASAVGIQKEIRIYSQIALPPSAALFDKELRILMGTHIPSLLSEYELEAVLTAEFGLILGNSPSADTKLQKTVTHWQLAMNNDAYLYPNFFLAIPNWLIEGKVPQLLREAEETDDSLRNTAVADFGIPSDYINGTAKLSAYAIFLKSTLSFCILEPTEPMRDLQERIWAEFRGCPLLKSEKCHTVLLHSSPLNSRMKTLGIENFTIASEAIRIPYLSEAEKLLKLGNDCFFTVLAENYEEQREEKYLAIKRIIDTYEEALTKGEIPDETEKIRAGLAYQGICRHDLAEKIFDEVLQDNPQNAYALFHKGNYLLERYEDSGIEYLYRAVKENRYFAEPALQQIAEYFAMLGEKEQHDAVMDKLLRKKADMIRFESDVHNIKSAKELSVSTLPLFVIDDIRNLLLSVAKMSLKRHTLSRRRFMAVRLSIS